MTKQVIVKSALLVMIASLLTRFLGLIRVVILADLYGAGSISDAFIIAFTLPNTVLICLGTSLGTAFIPMYQKNIENKNVFTSNVMNATLLAGVFLSVLFMAFPQTIVKLFASGCDENTFILAVKFTRIMMISTIPILLFRILKAYLRIHNAFFWATSFDALIILFVITGIYLSKFTGHLKIMAYATVVGHFICFAALYLSCKKYDFRYIPYLNLKDDGLKELLCHIGPIFLGEIVAELNTIIDRNFASGLMVGTISSINYAGKINSIIYSLLSTTFVTVLYPQLTSLVVKKKMESVRRYIKKSILLFVFLILPVSFFVYSFADPIVYLLFKRGQFIEDNVKITAQCVRMYAIGYIAVNINPLLNHVFYAFNDSKTPALNSCLAICLNLMMNFILVKQFQHTGLAFATSITAICSMLLLIYKINIKLGGLKIKYIISDCFKIAISCVVMILITNFLWSRIGSYKNTVSLFLSLFVCLAVSMCIYFLVTIMLKVGALDDIKKMHLLRRHNDYE